MDLSRKLNLCPGGVMGHGQGHVQKFDVLRQQKILSCIGQGEKKKRVTFFRLKTSKAFSQLVPIIVNELRVYLRMCNFFLRVLNFSKIKKNSINFNGKKLFLRISSLFFKYLFPNQVMSKNKYDRYQQRLFILYYTSTARICHFLPWPLFENTLLAKYHRIYRNASSTQLYDQAQAYTSTDGRASRPMAWTGAQSLTKSYSPVDSPDRRCSQAAIAV